MRSTLLTLAAASWLALFGAVAAANAETAEKAAAKVEGQAAGQTAGKAPAGDAAAGATTFIKCKVCHTVEKDVSKIGPSLHGIFGRKAGTLASFTNYSDPMKNSGVVWDEKSIAEFVKNPRTFIKNTRMLFIGLKDDQEIANLLAYLKSVK